jgi:hypothetical protein
MLDILKTAALAVVDAVFAITLFGVLCWGSWYLARSFSAYFMMAGM